jgi:hypothetical protein
MNLNLPFPGVYRVQVEVEDLLSGIRARAERKIEIKPPVLPVTPAGALQEESAELTAILETAANYCRRLKEGAFRFFCLEKVEEKILERNPQLRDVEPLKRRWHYDYQIIGAGGEIKEQRRRILDRTRPSDKPDASLETRFASRYSVFLPVTLLAAENRGLYRYRLIERITLKKRRCAVVDIQPRHPDRGEIAQGRAWIDETDGSVLKIEMNPRGVVGSRELEAAARRMSAELLLETTHWYLVESQGVRFPSETVFVEKYRFDKGRQTRVRRDAEQTRVIVLPMLETQVRTVEFYRLAQEYTRYRFFHVNSRVEIKDPE